MQINSNYILPDWPAPKNVRAVSTTRQGGHSQPPYESFNLGHRVDDDPDTVQRNREQLTSELSLPSEPMWLRQVHGAHVVDAAEVKSKIEADGSFTTQVGPVCVAMTADCLPVFLCNRAGSQVAILHAGWRGLAAGVIEAGVATFPHTAKDMMVWLGPAIGPDAFEVGEEVLTAFVDHDPQAQSCFKPVAAGKWLADIYELARQRLQQAGVTAILGGDNCTYKNNKRFFSFRRDGRCGRMASLIWLDALPESGRNRI